MIERVLLGDEALAQAAVDAGLSCAYGYPGTPSTEVMEYLIAASEANGFKAMWCTNEKTAYEEALGASLAGKRALITMKHVGLNASADAFVNSALLSINGGLVVCVADDPGMHSSRHYSPSTEAWLSALPTTRECIRPKTSRIRGHWLLLQRFRFLNRFLSRKCMT